MSKNNEKILTTLLDRPLKDMRLYEIYPHLSLKEFCMFAQTSKKTEKKTSFLRLLHTAVFAEPESYQQKDQTRLAAIAILKRHPELLFKEGMVTDHFGRTIKASPYQIFLGAGDIWALKQVHEEIIPNVDNGVAQAQAQFQAQFPYCQWPLDSNKGEEVLYDDRNKEQIKQVITQLKIIVEKITADPCTNGRATRDDTTQAVNELHKIFAPKKGGIIKAGLYFPLGIMKEIFTVYDAQYEQWSPDQLSFFAFSIIGGAEAALTAVDAQCCKNGLNKMYLDMKEGPDRRDGLFCRHPKGIPQDFYPVSDKLGDTMYVDPDDGYSCFPSSDPGMFDWYDKNGKALSVPWSCSKRKEGSVAAWITYAEQKQRDLGAIMQPCEAKLTEPWRCVII